MEAISESPGNPLGSARSAALPKGKIGSSLEDLIEAINVVTDQTIT
jgi:hypothetical protein